jgi:LmbE family N-acetylglucosaminyl deacetylase
MGRVGVAPYIAFLTDGGASHPSHPILSRDDIALRRREEANVAAAALGTPTNRLLFIGARDGTLGHLDTGRRRSIVQKIEEVLVRLRPSTVFVPCRRDGSSEHNAAFLLVAESLAGAPQQPRILEYPVWSIWNPTLLIRAALSCRRVWRVNISSVLCTKEQAIGAYRSQTQPIPPDSTSALPPGFPAMFLHGVEYLFEH